MSRPSGFLSSDGRREPVICRLAGPLIPEARETRSVYRASGPGGQNDNIGRVAQVLVKLYTTLKDRLKKPQMWIEARTAADVVRTIAQEGGPEVAALLVDEQGFPKNHFILTLDSEILDRAALDKTELKENSVLHIFPPISGG